MSKLSQLKQEAYQAGKKRNWDQAILLYEQILEKDKNNPTVINELGDLCLKTDDSQRAIRHFLNAAAKYRQTGLLNNAVAIFKKILRYDAQNLNAHWYLAETRAGQGLTVEGESHAMQFLQHSERVTGDIKEIFLKRCVQLFELLPGSRQIQEHLVLVFRAWSLNLEASRAQCLVAAMAHQVGQPEEGQRLAESAAEKTPEVRNYPEYQQWSLLANPTEALPGGGFEDFGTVELNTGAPAAEISDPAVDAARSFGELDIGAPTPAATPAAPPPEAAPASPAPETAGIMAHADPAGPEKDNDGCFSITSDEQDTLDDLMAQATSPAPEETVVPPTSASKSENAGLLDQLLSDIGGEDSGDDSSQLATITSEIGAVVGGGADGDEAGSLYEMGMVYLEMGLFDQACESFETAAADEEFTVRAHEMWGITLQRANRLDDAIQVLNRGIEHAPSASREENGLRYHLGRAHEQAGNIDEAVACYREIKQVDPTYLDVGQRLKQLVTV